jgi:hypothetical protein
MRRRASILTHRGHGPAHYDLILADGARCLALQFHRKGQRWTALWLPAHRRRYLAYSGPVGGARGAVRNVWSGFVQVRRLSHASHELIASFGGGKNLTVRGERVVLSGMPSMMPR